MLMHHQIKFKKTSRYNNRIILYPRTYNEVSYGLLINKYTIYNFKAISQIKFLFDKAVSRWLSKLVNFQTYRQLSCRLF